MAKLILKENELDAQIIAIRLIPVFEKFSDVLFAYLFGSYARGEWSTLSDIDLAVYVKEPHGFSFHDKLKLHGDCCRALRKNEVDLVVVNQTANLILQDAIIRQGKTIYIKDRVVFDEYELKILHQACDFKWQRQREVGV